MSDFRPVKGAYNELMRRLLTFAAFLLILSLVPVCAQRGGRGSGGSHGGFSGHSSVAGHVSGFGASHSSSFSGSHFAAGSRYYIHNRARGPRIYTYGYGNRWGYGYPYYGYPYYGYYDPYWWWDTYANDADGADQRAMANEMNQENLQEQQMLREQDQDLYARPMNRPRDTQSHDERAQTEPATLLIFRDQHQREIHNYAIVDGLLWNFTPQRIEKIPLAILDIPATIKANEDRGVDFRLPRSSEGQ